MRGGFRPLDQRYQGYDAYTRQRVSDVTWSAPRERASEEYSKPRTVTVTREHAEWAAHAVHEVIAQLNAAIDQRAALLDQPWHGSVWRHNAEDEQIADQAKLDNLGAASWALQYGEGI